MKKSKKENKLGKTVFKVTDPRGKVVVCNEGAMCHIIEGHPEVKKETVKETIVDPDYIRKSKHNESTHLYYAIVDTNKKDPNCFVSVVTFNQQGTLGQVNTAFGSVDKGSKGEIIWTRK